MPHTFRKCIEETPPLQDAYCPGLQALTNADAQKIAVDDTRRLQGSVNLDAALAEAHPQDPRWDYAVAYRRGENKQAAEVVFWIEVHPATSREVTAVLLKLRWLKEWLAQHAGELLQLPREFIWISSGKTALTLTALQRKKMALAGLRQVGRQLQIG